MLFPASTFLRRDPFALMQEIAADPDRILRPQPGPTRFPPVNVWHKEDAAALTAELPGVDADDLDISVEDDTLTLSGARTAPGAADAATWLRRERRFGQFRRSVRLPFRIDPDSVQARLRDGVLQVVVSRPEEDRPRRIEIQAA